MPLAGLCLCLLSVWVMPRIRAASESGPVGALEFLDGSLLHGRLHSASRERGLEWNSPLALRPIRFAPTGLAAVTFEGSHPVSDSFKPMCRFHFANGDDLYGDLTALNETEVELSTWFGGKIKAPRDSIRRISFFWDGHDVLYEGPTSPEGWVITHNNTANNGRGWRYQDGAFVTSEPGALGRNFKLPGGAIVEFDLEWSQPFSLALAAYSQNVDRFDFSASSYVFYLNRGGVTLQRMQLGVGISSIGRADLPTMLEKNRVRLELRFDMETAAILVLADGQLAGQWKDAAGFAARGGGLVFASQMSGPTVRIKNLRVARWDGRTQPPAGTNAPPSGDFALLANRDQLIGRLHTIQDGRMKFAAPQASLEVPLTRVRELSLGLNTNQPPPGGSWAVRAFVMGGGAVAFQLESWDASRIAGTSDLLGRIELDPRSIRQLQFNLNQPRSGAETQAIADDFDGLHE